MPAPYFLAFAVAAACFAAAVVWACVLFYHAKQWRSPLCLALGCMVLAVGGFLFFVPLALFLGD
jgi:hypothetical protein